MDASASAPVIVVGAGLAGLCCARVLHAAGQSVRVLDAADAGGGRLRTDVMEGFRLDRGFQVLQTAYPETMRELDYAELQLHAYEPGALIRSRRRFIHMTDFSGRPLTSLRSLLNGLGTWSDHKQLAQLRRHVTQTEIDALLSEPDTTTRDYLLHDLNFSRDIVERFLLPWFRASFLEQELDTSSRYFKFLFRTLAAGDVSLPADGMAAIAHQLAHHLPAGSLHLNCRVLETKPHEVRLESGEILQARAVVIATDMTAAGALANDASLVREWCGTTCLYFAAEQPPLTAALLILNGDGEGPINNMSVLTNVTASYAPPGKALMSVSVVGAALGDEELLPKVRRQLFDWFGQSAILWRHLRTYRIPHALPTQPPGSVDATGRACRLVSGLFCCGDHRQTASIQGAMQSGRRAAEAVLQFLAET